MFPSKWQDQLVDGVIEMLAKSTPDKPAMLLDKEHHVIHTNVVEIYNKKYEDLPSLVYIIWLDHKTALYIGKTDVSLYKRIETHWAKTEGTEIEGKDGKIDAFLLLEGKKLTVNHTESWLTFVRESKEKLGFDFSKANATLFKVRNAEDDIIKYFQQEGAGTYANKETYKEYNNV